MSEETIKIEPYMIPLPYETCDALMFYYLGMTRYDVAGARIEITSGSCFYSIMMSDENKQKHNYGKIMLRRALEHEKTVCHLIPDKDTGFEFLTFTLGMFWHWYELSLTVEENYVDIRAMPFSTNKTVAEFVAERIAAMPAKHTDPKKGDPIDTWLDWRTLKRKRKQRLTLDEIAVLSGHSISTLKKHSAQRKPRGTKGT